MRQKYMNKRAQETKDKVEREGKDYKAEFAGFVNFEWTDAHKENCIRWASELDFWHEYNQQCAKGRRISTQFDLYHQCYVSSAFERDINSPNAGLICTARGMDGSISLTRLLYLLSDALREGWGKSKTPLYEDKW